MNQDDLIDRDMLAVWHPCSQMKDHENFPLIPIKSGEGVWLHDYSGNRYLDAISSWWVNIFGHCNPKIQDGIKKQLETLEHVIFAGFSHQSGIELAEALKRLTPEGLNKCFYADNGSSAVEVALKMSFQYWRNKGKHSKKKFAALSNGYHGETTGALSVSDVALYKEIYEPLLWDVVYVPSPDCYHRAQGQSWRDYSLEAFEKAEAILTQNAEELSAIIVEPLVQCAGGMRMYDPVYLSRLSELCKTYNIHLIADEIAVGFGRTGTLFACEQANISPDFMCMSKGLTGGFLPLSAVMTHDHIYDAFYDEYEKLTGFLHSHSYTGNPLGCAAALATIDIFDSEPVMERNKATADLMAELTAPLVDHPHVADIRQTGMILAIELVKDRTSKEPFPWQERRGMRVYKHGLQNEMLLRPLGNIVYFMPPYVITANETERMVKVAIEGIEKACA